MDNESKRPLRIYIILTACMVVCGLVLWFIWSYSFIEITLADTNSQETSVALTNQASTQTSTIATKATTVKRFVKRGGYQISASQNDRSGLSIAAAPGLLRTGKVTVTLKDENFRKFIGNGPSPCMYYSGAVLASYECSDVSGLTVHEPATAQAATFNRVPDEFGYQYPQGIVRTKEGTILLTRVSAGEENPTKSMSVFLLDDSFTILKEVPLGYLDPSKQYGLSAYKDGFVIHRTGTTDAEYFSAVSAQPETISFGKTQNDTLLPSAWTTSGTRTAKAFSDNTAGEKADLDNDNPGTVKTEVVITDNGSDKRFFTDVNPTKIVFCGSNKVCLLNKKDLVVYSLVGAKPKYLYRVTGVDDVFPANNTVLLATTTGVWNFNPDEATGFRSFSFSNDYTYCGAHEAPGGYAVCVINRNFKKVALFVDINQANTDNINRKVSSLLSMSEVLNVSAYGRYLFISPNAGQMTAAGEDGYEPDEAKLTASRQKIATRLQELGITPENYTVIFTL